jgi:hypothetical protein
VVESQKEEEPKCRKMTVEELSCSIDLEQATLPFSTHLLRQKDETDSMQSGEEREDEMTEGVQPKQAYRQR